VRNTACNISRRALKDHQVRLGLPIPLFEIGVSIFFLSFFFFFFFVVGFLNTILLMKKTLLNDYGRAFELRCVRANKLKSHRSNARLHVRSVIKAKPDKRSNVAKLREHTARRKAIPLA
jgi:hypothetical protein